ncbi:pentapeptide repeat-containing protein [Nostoc sphaeroides]|uniref:Pentapeptide repeat-containing protein n=1 Tax=Nostoc sphaeroides CCNUC1 TaxID=2653204 RepID=A0A5P8WAL0_9NOSO|nr:pentapeptide repeat-containing protein [Nostoc sphaeroides]QFS49837.1 hypothetical protein GXM_07331 [Nostoc sphaeroides CCNUC1]
MHNNSTINNKNLYDLGNDFSHKVLNNCYFKSNDSQNELRDKKFINSTLERVNFTGFILVNVDFTNATLIDVDFTNTTFNKVILTNVNFINTNFENATLRNAIYDISLSHKIFIGVISLFIAAFSGFTSNIIFNCCLYFLKGKYYPIWTGLLSFLYSLLIRFTIVSYFLEKFKFEFAADILILIAVLLILVLGIFTPFTIGMSGILKDEYNINFKNDRNGDVKNIIIISLLVISVNFALLIIGWKFPSLISCSNFQLSIIGWNWNSPSDCFSYIRAALGALLGVFAGAIISEASIKNKNEKYVWLWNTFVNYACMKGNKFKNCNFKHTDFSNAKFRGCTFYLTNTNIINTKWSYAKQIDCCQIIGSYFSNPDIQNLLIQLNGINKNFDNLDLPGLYLYGAKLEKASFINTDLSESNLSNAILQCAIFEKTRLHNADLSNAKLTGIIIASRSIPLTTKLNDIECFFYYQPSDIKTPYPDKQYKLNSEEAIKYLQEKLPPTITFPDKNIDWEAFSKAVNNSLEILEIRLTRGTQLIQAFEDLNEKFIIKFNSFPKINEENLIEKIKEEYERERQVRNMENFTSLDNLAFNLANIQVIKFFINTVNLNLAERQTYYNLQNPLFGGGFSGDYGNTVGGELNNYSSNINLNVIGLIFDF